MTPEQAAGITETLLHHITHSEPTAAQRPGQDPRLKTLWTPGMPMSELNAALYLQYLELDSDDSLIPPNPGEKRHTLTAPDGRSVDLGTLRTSPSTTLAMTFPGIQDAQSGTYHAGDEPNSIVLFSHAHPPENLDLRPLDKGNNALKVLTALSLALTHRLEPDETRLIYSKPQRQVPDMPPMDQHAADGLQYFRNGDGPHYLQLNMYVAAKIVHTALPGDAVLTELHLCEPDPETNALTALEEPAWAAVSQLAPSTLE